MASENSLISCDVCKRQQVVDFATCLRSGWPKCHGYTMRLLHTTADVGAATTGVLRSQSGGSEEATGS